jgi:hypothetical protein
MKEQLNDYFGKIADSLARLEEKARKLPNHNIADIIKAAHSRVVQASQHPDTDMLAAQIERDERDHKEAPARNDGQKPFVFAEGHTDANQPAVQQPANALHPGDTAFDFQNANPDFENPENVDLNKDGTLKTAPNVLGTSDDRDK